MGRSKRIGFRPPLTSVLPVAGMLTLLSIILPSDLSGLSAIVILVIFGGLRIRQLLVLGEDYLEVTVLRTRRIPWSQVEGFEAGTLMRGGTRILTSTGVVNSISPCAWWGGPADDRDIETLRRIRAARVRVG